MNITVFYDYICPFSYIGSKRIQKIAGEYGIELEWKGFEIHPDYPPDGRLRKKSLKMARVNESLSSVMEEEESKFKLPGFVTNTNMALQAAEFAKGQNKFLEFHNICYESYMIDRKNIGDINVILQIGENAGIDKKLLEETLINNQMTGQLDAHKEDAAKADVLGVPTILFNDFRIHGVQSLETYRSFIKKFSN
ncbi:MAG: thioredoxin domain-containing protein [Candidatus Dadabacteria bacterium]|nr:thioredoxin domain-containing protein [Candidatus Dadabacteria bacterium]NIS09570.1 thioredoxin domain-containing protein [Candidatus Dadabacteria bacterium]NIV43079.1 thioredoxin domain-containing protein [Candidatus Dadabacteria bacterium]NIX16044.1 thioredoxin domain-containing protein [Candidatus Dadabacteria bacterium]NIY22747.1 thioredoxin domain-containing protein [Candidatus Dadabacteria bacterium]